MRVNYMMLLFSMFVIVACTEDELLSIPSGEVQSRSRVDILSTLNPDLMDNWENKEFVTLTTGDSVTLSWAASGSSHNFISDFALDVKKKMLGLCCLIHSQQWE